jgi:hypothetical protein
MSKKNRPNLELYQMLHNYFNARAGKQKRKLLDILCDCGYIEVTDKGLRNPNTQMFLDSRSISNRFNEVTRDMQKRLDKYGYPWKVCSGRTKAAEYGYEASVTQDLPEECRLEDLVHNLKIFSRDLIQNTMSSFANDKVEQPIISFSANDLLGKVELVKDFVIAIKEKKRVSFKYRTMKTDNPRLYTFSPWHLKEYNLRWFLFGYVHEIDGKVPNDYLKEHSVLYVDRIDRDSLKTLSDQEYHATDIVFSTYFNDIVGVTHEENEINRDKHEVTIETLNAYTHKRIKSKPIHNSQIELCPFSENHHGLFQLKLHLNLELETFLLEYGKNIMVKVDGEPWKRMVKDIDEMYLLYHKRS